MSIADGLTPAQFTFRCDGCDLLVWVGEPYGFNKNFESCCAHCLGFFPHEREAFASRSWVWYSWRFLRHPFKTFRAAWNSSYQDLP